MSLDKVSVGQGSLLEDFVPPVNPPREIDDPNDSKPENWDEREKMPDPDAIKPDDWDEEAPRKIPDPDAKKPDDWNEDEPEMVLFNFKCSILLLLLLLFLFFYRFLIQKLNNLLIGTLIWMVNGKHH